MARSGHVTDDVITTKLVKMYLAYKYLPLQHVISCFPTFNATTDTHLYPDSHFLKIVQSSLDIYILYLGQSEMPHANVLQATMTAFSVTNYFRHSEQKRTSEQSHVTNDVIALRPIQEVVYCKSWYSCWL